MAEQGLPAGLAATLLAWYDSHARVLPWRAGPGRKADPYHVWLSEIMLQQTTVAAVRDYYLKFLTLWPTVHDLAAADQEEVLKAWAGLGYYARARNLHACARQVVAQWGGSFPETVVELLTLPGVGPYTAGAIAAIAFDAPHAAVDGNVERVITRLCDIETPLPAAKPLIRARAETLVPPRRAGDFAQAMMDLGATVCTPRSPNCLICPWTEHCAGRRNGTAASLPRKEKKARVPVRRGIAFWVEREDGAILLRKRPEKGLLGNMLEVPSSAWEPVADPEARPPVAADWRKLPGRVEHTFTHFHLELEIWAARVPQGLKAPEDGTYRWVARRALPAEALPSVMRKVAAFADETIFSPA